MGQYINMLGREKIMRISKVGKTIEKYRMLEKGDRVVVAVSGGPDSVLLLHVLNELRSDFNLVLIVAHMDHGIRGVESKKEWMFVESLASQLGLPFESRSVDVPALKKAERLSTQQVARDARYKFFLDTLKKFGAQKVALGHNADDQAETVLMRFMRGAGTKGLCGIPPVRDGVFIRPLIEIERRDIECLLRRDGIEFVTDSSNKDNTYLRNRIRNTLIPILMKEYNPGIVKSLVHTSEIFRKEDEFLERLACDHFSRTRLSGDHKAVTLDISRLQESEEPIQVRVLRKAIECFSGNLKRISFKHMESIMSMLSGRSGNKSLSLPGGTLIERRYNELIVRRDAEIRSFCYSFSQLPQHVRLEEIGKDVEFKIITPGGNLRMDINPNVAFMDYDRIKFPMVIRNFEEGDRFQPMGLKGTKKLKDLFIDCKIPRSVRKQIPLLLFDGVIAWVMGLRIDHRVMVRDFTSGILKVKIF